MNHAVAKAFEGLISEKHHPGYFIFMEMDPKTIDINIHPTKTEIKFENESSLYEILRSVVKHALGMYNVMGAIDFTLDPDNKVSFEKSRTIPKEPQIEVNKSYNPFSENSNTNSVTIKKPSWEKLYVDTHASSLNSSSTTEDEQVFSSLATTEDEKQNDEMTILSSLSEEVPFSEKGNKIFQLFNQYIVTSSGGALLVIDQEKAHKRVLYERFKKSLKSEERNTSQKLIFPITFELSPTQSLFFHSIEEDFVNLGYEFETQNAQTLLIKSIPTFTSPNEVNGQFNEFFKELQENGDNIKSDQKTEYFAKLYSKALSVKRGKPLSSVEQQKLVDDLFGCQDWQTSPFKEKIVFTMEKKTLDKKFKLDV